MDERDLRGELEQLGRELKPDTSSLLHVVKTAAGGRPRTGRPPTLRVLTFGAAFALLMAAGGVALHGTRFASDRAPEPGGSSALLITPSIALTPVPVVTPPVPPPVLVSPSPAQPSPAVSPSPPAATPKPTPPAVATPSPTFSTSSQSITITNSDAGKSFTIARGTTVFVVLQPNNTMGRPAYGAPTSTDSQVLSRDSESTDSQNVTRATFSSVGDGNAHINASMPCSSTGCASALWWVSITVAG